MKNEKNPLNFAILKISTHFLEMHEFMFACISEAKVLLEKYFFSQYISILFHGI